MNTMPDPFVPTHPPSQPQPPTPSTVTERPKRRSGGKKKPASGRTRKVGKSPALASPHKAIAEQVLAVAPKKPRKPRVVKEATSKARKLDIGAIVSATAGLKSDDARLLVKIYTMLSDHSARSRAAITASLGKLFA